MTAQKNQTKFIAIGVAAAIAAIIAVVLVVGGGGSSSSTTNTAADVSLTDETESTNSVATGTATAAGEYQTVEATGELLSGLEDPNNDPARGAVAPVLKGLHLMARHLPLHQQASRRWWCFLHIGVRTAMQRCHDSLNGKILARCPVIWK